MKKIIPLIITAALMLASCAPAATTATASPKLSSSPAPVAAEATASPVKAPAAVKTLDPDEATKRIISGDKIQTVDIRSSEAYVEGHITGAVSLPYDTIGSTPPDVIPVLDAKLYIYGADGEDSAKAAKKLVRLGYTDVTDISALDGICINAEKGAWQIKKKQTLASFSTWDIYGRYYDENIFKKNDLTMVAVWSTTCGPCAEELPDFVKLSKELKGVTVIGVCLDTAERGSTGFSQFRIKVAREMLAKAGGDFITLMPSTDLIMAKLGGIYAMPSVFFVNSKGEQVGKDYPGAHSYSEWADIVKQISK